MVWIRSRGLLVPVVVYGRRDRDCEETHSQSSKDPCGTPVVCYCLPWTLDVRELSERLLLPSLRQRVATGKRIRNSCLEQRGNLQCRSHGPLHEAPTNTQGAGTSDLDGAFRSRRARLPHDPGAPRRTAPDQHDKKGDAR